MYIIDSNIPLPASVRRGRGSTYPFADMQVGDSFFVPTKDEVEDKRAMGRLTAATRTFRKADASRANIRFSIRPVTEGIKNGVRIWRTV